MAQTQGFKASLGSRRKTNIEFDPSGFSEYMVVLTLVVWRSAAPGISWGGLHLVPSPH